MIRRTAKIAGLAAALTLLGGSSAEAQSTSWFVCGGTTFNTCAAVHLSVGAPVGGVSTVTLNVWNLSGLNGTYGGAVFTKIGFFNTGNALAVAGSLSMTGPVRAGDTPQQWQIGDPNSAGGVQLDLATSANGSNSGIDNGIANGCDPASAGGQNNLWENPCINGEPVLGDAGWITMTFQVTGTWDVANTEMLIQAQDGPDGMSTQCITGQGCSVVPEPGTWLLLGTGLAGLGLVGFIRRRREEDLEDQVA